MFKKRSVDTLSLGGKLKRRKSGEDLSFFQKTLLNCGLVLKNPPEKCVASQDTVHIVRNLRKKLMERKEDVQQFLADFENACNDKETFHHYMFVNIDGMTSDVSNTFTSRDTVIKILLNVTVLQKKLIEYIFDKLIDLLGQPDFEPWVKITLKSLSGLDINKNSDVLATKLIDLLDICSDSDKAVRLEIINAIPDIIGDKEHDNVASEMRRIMSTNRDLLPSILDCLTYLCISESQFKLLQQEVLKCMYPSNTAYFSNFVKFLLMSGRLNNSEYEETIKGLRKELAWSTLATSQEDIATSQVLTATAIRNSMLSSKDIAKAWLNVLSSCQINTDHKPIDIVFFLILYSVSEEKEKQVESLMKKQIKMQILKENILDEAFKKFKPIFRDNLVNSMSLISLANSLLRCNTEPLVQTFAAHMYTVMFSELTDCCPIIVSELLQLVLSSKKSVLNILNILNIIASQNLSLLISESLQILTLLDRMDEMTLTEVRAVMDLVCRLAFSVENSGIRNDIRIIISKELGSSIPSIKIHGILSGINAVKYLTKNKNGDNGNGTGSQDKDEDDDDITLSMSSRLPDVNLREAAQIIELISLSTRYFPDMIAFFYDELYNIIQHATDMNISFVNWLTKVLTENWQENFLIDKVERATFGEIRISTQFCLNQDSEVDEQWSVNIAGLTLEDNKQIDIEILSPLFQLVRGLHYKKNNGDLSSIDALLGCPIIMPIVDVDSIADLSEAAVSNILDCHIHCVNWIRELLNAFASQEDDDNILKPKILNRILHLRELEKTIEEILLRKDMTYKPPCYFSQALNISSIREQVERKALKSQVNKQKKGKKPDQDETILPGSITSQQTQMVTVVENNLAAIHNIHFRPLSLTLIEILRYDLSPHDENENKLSFKIFNYLLKHLNGSLEKILVSRIKKQTYLNKDAVEIYNRSEAEKQVKIIREILPKIIVHMDFITSFIKCHMLNDKIEPHSMYQSKITECCLCLENTYNLLTIYFRWFEFKNNHSQLLQSSLRVIAKLEVDNSFSMTNLLSSFQEHEKYCTTLSFAVALIELMKALQEHSTDMSVPPILKNMAYNFLSKEWKEHEKGLIYNQDIDTLTKVYLENNTLKDLNAIFVLLVNDVKKLRDKTSTLPTMKSIHKGNFSIFFRNLGTVLFHQIKTHINETLTFTEQVEMWGTAASVLNAMSLIAKSIGYKTTLTAFFKKAIQIFSLFLIKGFPILKNVIDDDRDLVLDVIREFTMSTKRIHGICSQSKGKFDRTLTKKMPGMKKLLMNFYYKTRDLLKANDCLNEMNLSHNIPDGDNSKNKSKKAAQKTRNDQDVTIEDCDDDLPEDVSDDSSECNQKDDVGISDIV